jgi:hypothetical protein
MYISQQYDEVLHVVDGFALEALFEQVSVATVLPIIIVHVGTCNAFDGLSHSFIAFANQEVEVVAHEAVGVIAAVTATSVALVIIPNAHPVEGIDELVVVFLVLKDILVVDASHHHVEYPRT